MLVATQVTLQSVLSVNAQDVTPMGHSVAMVTAEHTLRRSFRASKI